MPKPNRYWSSKRGEGEAITWLRNHIDFGGDECLMWPFCRVDTGYGSLGFEGRRRYAHRIMCELVHGAPPSPTHQACHSCGKGQHGCVNPRHLSWKTNKENQMDRAAHGTWRKRGSARFKLTPEAVAEIRAIGNSETKKALAARFGTSRDTVAKILDGRVWRTAGQYPRSAIPNGGTGDLSDYRKTTAEHAAEYLIKHGHSGVGTGDNDLIRAILAGIQRTNRRNSGFLESLSGSPLFKQERFTLPGQRLRRRYFRLAAHQQSPISKKED